MFGNASGESIASQSQPEPSVPAVASAEEKAAILDLFRDGPGVAPASAYTGRQAWAADVAARRAGSNARQVDELLAAVGSGGVNVDTRPGSVYVQAGDSLSKIAARFPEYGNVNDLKNQLIAANPQLRDPNALTEGMELNFPGAGTVVDRAAMARAMGADGRYQAALAAQQPDAQEPVWSFREASVAQRKLDDARALAEYQARLASQPMQYVGPIDDAGIARAAMEQKRSANNLAAALGGPFVAAPMLAARSAGFDEFQVEQAGMLGLSALDAAGVKSGGTATRLASGGRRVLGSSGPSFLTAEEFAQLPSIGTINPRTVRFSQDSASAFFKKPFGSVDDFIEGLGTGKIDPANVEPVRIVQRDGKVFTLDNRRLYSFQEANLDIPYQKLDTIPKRELFKFTTQNDGTSIVIRRGK